MLGKVVGAAASAVAGFFVALPLAVELFGFVGFFLSPFAGAALFPT